MVGATGKSKEVMKPTDVWRVMIVEDHAAVAALHKRIVDSLPHLKTEHVAPNGERAKLVVGSVSPDLIILDLTMNGGNGMAFLRWLRKAEFPVDVIMVTATRSSRVVQEATHLGVLDYLVKPFSPHRLRRALTTFGMRHLALSKTDDLNQSDIDVIQAPIAEEQRELPKGLKRRTMNAVLSFLEINPEPATASEVGTSVGIARVTARRYLQHLEFTGKVERSQVMDGPGRPKDRYKLRNPASNEPDRPVTNRRPF